MGFDRDTTTSPPSPEPRPPGGSAASRRAVESAPPPLLGRAAAGTYAIAAVLLVAIGAGFSVTDRQPACLGFCAPIALYCAGLALGTLRLRCKSADQVTSAGPCTPLLAHAVLGLLGTAVVAVDPPWSDHFRTGTPAGVVLTAAMFGMLFGWVPALIPFTKLRRGGVLLLAALSGMVLVFVALSLSPMRGD